MVALKTASRFFTQVRVALIRSASSKASEEACPCPEPEKTAKKAKISGLKRFIYNWSGFNKYGLYHDDCLNETEDVKEALRRLPQKLKDERNFRQIRAIQHSMMKVYLPKEEWTKIENDKRYLQPYLKEVVKEREEREEWNRN